MPRPLPSWPRTPRLPRAAAYVEMSERDFLSAVNDGTMPAPFTLAGRDAWDLRELDDAIDAIKAGAQRKRSWQERAPARV